MVAEAETLSITPEKQEAADQEETQARSGVTLPAVLVGLALLGVLALCMPYWTLVKGYPLGFGGYLPVEAFFLLLAVLVFNRFRGVFALVVGLMAVTAVVPSWAEAVYARGDQTVKALPVFAHWLRTSGLFMGMIDSARDVPGRSAFLLFSGGLLVFLAAAVPAYLLSLVLPLLRRRLFWREMAVIFMLLAVGTYSCKSVEWLVGMLSVPHKFDNSSRDFKGKFLRPVPLEQQVLTDEALIKDLASLEEDPAKIASLPRFRHYRTLATIRALERLAADPADAGAAAELREDGWGAESRAALQVLEDKKLKQAELRDQLSRLHGLAVSQSHTNAREEALDMLRAENPGGVPSKLMPYDLYRYDQSTPEGARKYLEVKEAIKRFGKGWYKTAPVAPRIDVPRPKDFTDVDPKTGEEKFDAEGYAQLQKLYAKTRLRYVERLDSDRRVSSARFWSYWKGPLKWWIPLLVLFMLLQVFLAAILRRQWCDHEKLMFPHAEVVRGLIQGDEPGARARRVLSCRSLWMGAGVAVAMFTLQGLNHYYPAIPAPLEGLSLKTFLSEPPWDSMEKEIKLLPYVVGVAYVLTAEVSFSIWFFAMVNQGLRVITMAWGLPRAERWAIHGETMNSDALYTGAMFVFVLWLIWGGRRHIWYVLRRGLGLIPPDRLEKREPMSYPVAFWGFWLSLTAILAWFAMAGVKLWIIAVVIAFYLVLVILMCRVISEAGLIVSGLFWWPFMPQEVFCRIFGFGQAGTFGRMVAYKDCWLSAGGAGKMKSVPASIRAMGLFQFCWPSMLFHLQLTPFVLAGFKLTETEPRPRRKRLLTVVAVAGLLGAMLLFLNGTMNLVFEHGADNMKVYGFQAWSWGFNNTLLRDTVTAERMWTPDIFKSSMMGVGGLVMAGLLWLRSTFYWWPLHPIGFVAFGAGWGVWFSFFLGWLFKRTALAYGGGEFSQKINPFFYGLVGGHILMAAIWAIIALCGQDAGWVSPLIIPSAG